MNPSIWLRTAAPKGEDDRPAPAESKHATAVEDDLAPVDAENASAEAAARAVFVRMHREAVAHIAAIAEPWLELAGERSASAAAEAEHVLVLHQRPAVPVAETVAA